MADVELFEGNGVGTFACFFDRLDRSVHWGSAPAPIIRFAWRPDDALSFAQSGHGACRISPPLRFAQALCHELLA
jgi:hypothetical protein